LTCSQSKEGQSSKVEKRWFMSGLLKCNSLSYNDGA
jgi:hypothetical protein